jgi:hypothetical protein
VHVLGASKNAHLKALEGARERLQLLKADLLDYNSIASAVAGCEGVFHVASPVPSGRSSNPEVNLLRTSSLFYKVPRYNKGSYRWFSAVISRLQPMLLLAWLQALCER